MYLNMLLFFISAVPSASSAPLASSLRDVCGHTLRRPSGFFDSTFLKRFFKHLIPFTSSMRVKMQFYLYKRDFAECGREIITDDGSSLEMSDFNPEHPTRFVESFIIAKFVICINTVKYRNFANGRQNGL